MESLFFGWRGRGRGRGGKGLVEKNRTEHILVNHMASVFVKEEEDEYKEK